VATLYLREGTYATALGVFVLRLLPKLRRSKYWQGITIMFESTSGKIVLVNLFAKKKGIKLLNESGLPHKLLSVMAPYLVSIPVIELYEVDAFLPVDNPKQPPMIKKRQVWAGLAKAKMGLLKTSAC